MTVASRETHVKIRLKSFNDVYIPGNILSNTSVVLKVALNVTKDYLSLIRQNEFTDKKEFILDSRICSINLGNRIDQLFNRSSFFRLGHTSSNTKRA